LNGAAHHVPPSPTTAAVNGHGSTERKLGISFLEGGAQRRGVEGEKPQLPLPAEYLNISALIITGAMITTLSMLILD